MGNIVSKCLEGCDSGSHSNAPYALVCLLLLSRQRLRKRQHK